MDDDAAQEWADDPDVTLERPEPTGVERVDAVIAAVGGLGSTTLGEQVAAYEQAHLELRAVLDDPAAAGA